MASRAIFFSKKNTPRIIATPPPENKTRSGARVKLFEGHIQDRIFPPILVIKMPPLGLVYRKAFRLHGAAKQIAVPSLERRASGIIGEGARRHFVVGSWHFDWFASRQIVESEIGGAAAVVAGALRGIGDEDFPFGRSGIPEYLRDVPRAIGVVDQQAVAEGFEFLLDAQQSFGRWALQKGACLRINGSAEKVVRCGVANIQ